MLRDVPAIRIRTAHDAEVNAHGDYVLYWMIAFRRCHDNFSFDRAIEWCQELGKPLTVLEALRCDYPWASDRLHQFVIQGMADNAAELKGKGVYYYPYVEPQVGAGKGLLRALANRACVVVTDDCPAFFLPRMIHAAAQHVPVRFELVDSNGLLPLRAAEKVFSRAYDFRCFLQKNLLEHLAEAPQRHPVSSAKLARPKPPLGEITSRWPLADPATFFTSKPGLAGLPINHAVKPGRITGGARAAESKLAEFCAKRLPKYVAARNQPEEEATSDLSPYLHFGHISAHRVFDAVTRIENWTPQKLSKESNGSASGWWGISDAAEAFFDQLITWRELGYNMCWQSDTYDQYESLPVWAQATLDEHASDQRQHVYSLPQFEAAATHDELWNAAQRQLVLEGRMHNYLRMLWGKKILERSASPRDALAMMIDLNNKYALDGRNPNSYSGIFWVLGRYDRPWGPERPIFGKIRYMSSANTARKVRVKRYIAKYSATERQQEMGT